MENSNVCHSLDVIYEKVQNARSLRNQSDKDISIVAVSKTKPKSLILEAYSHGHRYFGENYVTELAEKAHDIEILEMCPDIKWHFIGHLQSNKVNKLIGIPNLFMVQTIDSIKLADAVNKAWSKEGRAAPLNVMIQVNTSGEKSKSGISPDECIHLAHHILENCKQLNLSGIMTIGTANHDPEMGPNPEFELLYKCRDQVCEGFQLNPESLDLSMGMSHDFEHAIERGSTCVRIGSSIFGSRNKADGSSIQ